MTVKEMVAEFGVPEHVVRKAIRQTVEYRYYDYAKEYDPILALHSLILLRKMQAERLAESLKTTLTEEKRLEGILKQMREDKNAKAG